MSLSKQFTAPYSSKSSGLFSSILKILCILLGASLFLITGCSITQKRIGEKDYTSMQNVSYSSDDQNFIFTVYDNNGTQMLFVSINGHLEVVLVDEFIKFSPVINNAGVFAYAKSEYSTSQSKIYINNTLLEITNDNRLYSNLSINERYLVFSCSDFVNNQNYMYILDLPTQKIIERQINDAFIQKIHLFENNKMLVEIYSTNSFSRKVILMDVNNLEMECIAEDHDADSLIYRVETNGEYVIANVSGENDFRYLFNAFHILYSASKNSDFSYSNNFMGRITWSESYRLCAMTKLWSNTKDESLKNAINDIVSRIIFRINANNLEVSDANPKYGWATTKYSYDKTTPISLLVDDSLIHYSLLNAVQNEVITDINLQNTIIDNAQKYVEYQERFFDAEKSLYRIPYGIQFELDGVIAPFNWQNAFGLMLIELYKLTGQDKYEHRVTQIAEAFHREVEYTNDGRLLWHYWPAIFYEGWTVTSRISKNTPEREATKDDLYEDFSHAGLNLKFVAEYNKHIDENLFRNYKSLLNNTLDSMINENGTFSRFMNGFSDQPFSFHYLPKFGWSELNNPKLNIYYENLLPYIYPEFDSMELAVAYIERINEIKNNQIVTIDFSRFNKHNELIEQYSINYNIGSYRDFFTYYQQ